MLVASPYGDCATFKTRSYFEADAISTDPVIIPAGVITNLVSFNYIVLDLVTGDNSINFTNLTLGATCDVTPIAGQTLTFRVNMDGSFDMLQTLGADTFRVTMWSLWM
jgi:hypothetical protein